VILGDSRYMGVIPDESIHLVLTAPPTQALKGMHQNKEGVFPVTDYEAFLSGLKTVWEEVYRILVPGGRLIGIIGDIWLSRKKYGRHRVIPLYADICVLCRKIGYDNLTPIIWHKISEKLPAVKGGTKFLGAPYGPNGGIGNNVGYVLMQRKPGGYRKPDTDQKMRSRIPRSDYKKWFQQVWRVPHPAGVRTQHPFPLEMACRLIRMFSFWDDTVLDPFCSTGTTLAAAMQCHRNSIGIDSDIRRCRMAFNRLQAQDEPLFTKTAIEFLDAGRIKKVDHEKVHVP